MARAKRCRLCNTVLKAHEQPERICDKCLKEHSSPGQRKAML